MEMMPTLIPYEAVPPTTSTVCPADHVHLPGGEDLVYGDHDEERKKSCACDPWVLGPGKYDSVPPFCVAKYPFPGEGYDWPGDHLDALNFSVVQDLRFLLPRWGRRLCSWSESLYTAAGPNNRRFQFGEEWIEGRCSEDSTFPERPIGKSPECSTPEGVMDIAVRSNWTIIDPAGEPHLRASIDDRVRAGMIVLTTANWGKGGDGFGRDNYGVHFHMYPWGSHDRGDPPGERFRDDGLRVCADPGKRPSAEREAEYARLKRRVATTHDYAGMWAAPAAHPISSEAGWTQVVAGRSTSCGIRQDGSVGCWGLDAWGESSPPKGSFTSVDLGWRHGCGLRTDGTIACWGDDAWGQATPPEGTFVSVGAADFFNCALDSEGAVTCWGQTTRSAWQAPPADQRFETLAVGGMIACGISGGASTCWGDNRSPLDAPPSEFAFVSMDIDFEEACGLTEEGLAVCWVNPNRPKPVMPQEASQRAVAAGALVRCTLGAEGAVTCSDEYDRPELVPPAGVKFESISVGFAHACGITEGRVRCWGGDSLGQASPP